MKRTMLILAGGLLAAAMILLLPVAFHSGTTQAQAPPATFWKVSMPDLGQHSDAWCWAGAAADSFWWFADNAGQTRLLGGAGKPWKNIDADSTNPLSACWYDARDAVDGLPAPVKGYPTVLRKIAESTFMDADQDGVKDAGEQNYCYGQGVEKWDYLIGLRDYVNTYGSGLAVHDIIDPAKCVPGSFGLKVDRNNPTMNTRNPCGGPVPGGVPGVSQVAGPPQFLDYQTELSGGQDVLLWMEPAPGEYFAETAHVVTGVGYNNAGGVFGSGTVTISDPWTHTTTPPLAPPPLVSASHTDALPGPWQSKPDHNNSPNHGTLPATEPYNRCDVKQLAPFQIQCYNEDTGAAQPWQVVDMIFVSPLPGVGGVQEMPDAAGGAAATSTAGQDSSSLPYAAIAGVAAGLVVLGAGGWYARRRWLS